MELALILLLLVPHSIAVSNKIINGALASEGQFPHMVQLAIKTSGPSQYCGGSLISDQWILTVILKLDLLVDFLKFS